jgi:hypothetical protein
VPLGRGRDGWSEFTDRTFPEAADCDASSGVAIQFP